MTRWITSFMCMCVALLACSLNSWAGETHDKYALDDVLISTTQDVAYPWRSLHFTQELTPPLHNLEVKIVVGGRYDLPAREHYAPKPPRDLLEFTLLMADGKYKIEVPQHIRQKVITPRLQDIYVLSAAPNHRSDKAAHVKIVIPFGAHRGLVECWKTVPDDKLRETMEAELLNYLRIRFRPGQEVKYDFEVNCPSAMRPKKIR